MQASYQGYQPVYGGGYQMGQYLGGPDIVPAAYTEMGEQGYGCPPGGCGNDVYGHGGCGHGGCHSCSSGCNHGCNHGCGLRGHGGCGACGHHGCDDCWGSDGCSTCGFFNPLGIFACGWRVRGEAVLLHRTLADQVAYAFTNDPTNPVLSNNNLDYDYNWSFRVSAERRVHENNSIEVTYMGLWNWDNRARFNSPAGDIQSFYDFGGLPVLGFDGATSQEIGYSSDFHNAEINYWTPLPCGCLGAVQVSTCWGVRYVRITEDFLYTSITPTHTGRSLIATDNDLVGGQFGWLVTMPLNCNWALRWGGKVGVYGNAGRQHTTVDATAIGGATTEFVNETVRRGDAAFVGGTDVQLSYRVNCGLSLFAGAEFLWVDGVALAAEQFNPVLGPGRQEFINDNGLAFFQGFNFGVEYTW